MQCRVDHSDADSIPAFLCRTCNPVTRVEYVPTVEQQADVDAAAVERLRRRDLRELRAEVKVWRNRVTLMKKHKTHPADLRKAEEALRKCEHDLYLVA